jgi:hypothetical protein
MAKIKNYLPDNNITDKDIVIGSDGDASGVTKNFNVGTLKQHILEDVPTSIVETIIAGANITVDNTDPSNPVISSLGGGGTLGLIKIVDKAGDFFTNLATASAYIRTFTSATITNESYSNGTFWFTVPNGSSFNGAEYFLGHASILKSAYIEDTLGLITTFGVDFVSGIHAFKYNSGNNILGNATFARSFVNSTGNNSFGNCTFGNASFSFSTGSNSFGNCTFKTDDCFNSSTGINRFTNILLQGASDNFGRSSSGRFEIYGTIGTTTGNDYANFFTTNTAVIWAQKVMQTNNGGGIEGDLARAQTNGAKLFFGYADGGATDLSYTASPTNGIVVSSTGTDATIPLADGTNAGLLSPSEKTAITNIPTKTSDLINDGDNGTSHFISLDDLPSNLVLYPTSTASDIGGYSKIVTSITDSSYDATAVNITTGAISGSNQLIASLATSANIIIGNPGLFNVSTIGNIRRTVGSGTAEFYFEVYKRTSGGTETLITTSSNTSPISSAIYSQFSATALWNDGIFLATDRIVLKFYGTKVGSGSNPTYDFQFGGSNPVRTTVPIPLNVVPNINLNDINDVEVSTPLDNDVLTYEASSGLWKNKVIGLGVPLTRQEFNFTGSQSFTLSNTPSAIYAVFVNGQELNSSQYSFVTTTLTIVDTLESGDKINIIYTQTVAGVLDYYTKAEIDTFNYPIRPVATTVTTTNSTPTTIDSVAIPTNTSKVVKFYIKARNAVSGFVLGAECFFTANNIAGVVSEVSTMTMDRKSGFPTSVTPSIEVSGTNINIKVTGATSQNINWECYITQIL